MPVHALALDAPVPVRVVVDNLYTRMSLLGKLFSQSDRSVRLTPVHGLFHFHWDHGEQKSRVHLRIDPDDSGLLIVNANRVFHLNPTATHMAYYALNKTPAQEAVNHLSRKFDVPKNDLLQDYNEYQRTLVDLLDDRVCPICDLDLETTLPFSTTPTAPYRMDIALTYRCNNACAHCYNDRPRDFPELTTDEWRSILDQLWALGIPHVVFTGGEPTLRDDLPDLIHHAEQNGQITGLNTNGRRMADASFVQKLLDAGLDHVQITLESHDHEIHDHMVCHRGAWEQTVAGIRNALATRLYVMTNTTMLTNNYKTIPDTLAFLARLGVPTVGLNALIYSGRGKSVGTGIKEKELEPLLMAAKESTIRNGQKLIWYTPTQYCNFDPVNLDLGVKGCTAALYNMCLEPDGSVLPCQSYYYSLGNIQATPWEQIWNHELCLELRERRKLPEKCDHCLIQQQCGGGCPLRFDN